MDSFIDYRRRAVFELENPKYVFAVVKKAIPSRKNTYVFGFATGLDDGTSYYFRREDTILCRIEDTEHGEVDVVFDGTEQDDGVVAFVGPLKFRAGPRIPKRGSILFGERAKRKKGPVLKWYVQGNDLLKFKNALKYGLRHAQPADKDARRIIRVLWGRSVEMSDEECKALAFFLMDARFYTNRTGKTCEQLEKKILKLKELGRATQRPYWEDVRAVGGK